MADFSLGSQGTGRVEAWENWNNSDQVSMHYKLSAEIRGGAWNAGPGPTWSGNIGGGHVGSGAWSYTSNGWRTLREFDVTFNKDANGNISIGVHGYINGANAPYVGAGEASWTHYPARIGVAPTIVANTADTITSTSVRLGTEISSVGKGTSAACRFYYKTPAAGSWTATGDQGDVGGYNYFNVTGLTPNQKYYRLARWWNNNGDQSDLPSAYPSESYVFHTKAAAPVAGTPSVLATTASVPYTQATGGGAYAITSKYRIKQTAGGTYGAWTDGSGGTFEVTGLLPNTEYTLQTRSTTTAGDQDGAETTFTTLPAGKIVNPDGSVQNAIPRLVQDGVATAMVNINIIDPTP